MPSSTLRQTAVTGMLFLVLLPLSSENASALDAAASRPAFREVLSADEYRSRCQRALETIGDWKSLDESKAPVIGLRVTAVISGDPGARLGLRAGDVIVSVEDQIVWGGSLKLTGESRQRMVIYSPSSNSLRTESVQAVRLGIHTAHHWQPELAFLRGGQRSGRFDETILVGILSRGNDPDLAETAWFHAVQSGYVPDPLSDQVGLEIALLQNRSQVAAEYAALLEPRFTDDPTIHPMLLLRAALATGNFERAHRVVTHQDRFRLDTAFQPDAFRRLASLRDRLDEADRQVIPSEAAKTMFRHDITDRLIGADVNSFKAFAPRWRAGRPVTLEAEVAYYESASITTLEPTPNFEITIKVRVKPASSAADRFLNSFGLELVPVNLPSEVGFASGFRAQILDISLLGNGTLRTSFGNVPSEVELFDATLAPLNDQPVELRFLRVGSQSEIQLNGHRIYLGPCLPAFEAVQLNLNSSGARTRVDSLRFVELIERP